MLRNVSCDRSIRMPSSEFKRIVTELSTIGDTVNVSVTKDGIKFSTTGDIGSANITCRQAAAVDKQARSIDSHISTLPEVWTACNVWNTDSQAE